MNLIFHINLLSFTIKITIKLKTTIIKLKPLQKLCYRLCKHMLNLINTVHLWRVDVAFHFHFLADFHLKYSVNLLLTRNPSDLANPPVCASRIMFSIGSP